MEIKKDEKEREKKVRGDEDRGERGIDNNLENERKEQRGEGQSRDWKQVDHE